MVLLEAGRVLTEFYKIESPVWDVLSNFGFHAVGLGRLGPDGAGKPEWYEAAMDWLGASDEERREVARKLLLEALDKPRKT